MVNTDVNILVVEDNVFNMELTVDLLKSYGYNATKAEDGYVALEKLKDTNVNLILLDMQLPKMDGLELLSKLKNNPETNDIPVIALTAHAMLGDKERFIDAGCDGYISKPLDIHEFKIQIDQHLNNNC
ncbi:MAG: response regulator [Methanohalobium sp.]|uniref:response regulator n=1 Tax=Methanohalobium sp. TaxID=2837493 RepID=UPI00397BCE60